MVRAVAIVRLKPLGSADEMRLSYFDAGAARTRMDRRYGCGLTTPNYTSNCGQKKVTFTLSVAGIFR
jgi:hypothetical protein